MIVSENVDAVRNAASCVRAAHANDWDGVGLLIAGLGHEELVRMTGMLVSCLTNVIHAATPITGVTLEQFAETWPIEAERQFGDR